MHTTKRTDGRGGVRPGAGRPALPPEIRLQQITVSLSQADLAILRTIANRPGQAIRAIIAQLGRP